MLFLYSYKCNHFSQLCNTLSGILALTGLKIRTIRRDLTKARTVFSLKALLLRLNGQDSSLTYKALSSDTGSGRSMMMPSAALSRRNGRVCRAVSAASAYS
jgi:hypothetical protein